MGSRSSSIGKTATDLWGLGIESQGSECRGVNKQLKALACEIKIGTGYAGMDRTKPLPTFDHILSARNPHQSTCCTEICPHCDAIQFISRFFFDPGVNLT